MPTAEAPKTLAASRQPTSRAKTEASGRNLVILCDGTSNELGRNMTNVLKLYRIAEKGERQIVYYNPGVGTVGRIDPWRRFSQKIWEVVGLATGYGLDNNVLAAYRFLVENWREGDRIFLFGFSRGAWTVRVLAGLLHLIGLVRPAQLNMSNSALGTYKRASKENDLPLAWHFARVIGARRVTIDFVGVWDTVASVIVPRPDRFWIPSLETLPYTETNPSVAVFRHALALDEHRRMFRAAPWTGPQTHVPNPFDKRQNVPQDIEQRWFAGCHSDIGGGFPEVESQLSKLSLIWMVEEAAKFGMHIVRPSLRRYAYGDAGAVDEHDYVAPSPLGPKHPSATGFWWVLEYLPKRVRYREWRRRALFGFYIPACEPRAVEPAHVVDTSIAARIAGDPAYRPVNLPPDRMGA